MRCLASGTPKPPTRLALAPPRYNLEWLLGLCATGLGSAGVSRTSWAVRRAFVPHRIPLSHQYPAEQHIVRTSLDLSRFPGDS